MKYSNIILGGLVAFAGTAVAMPTQEETKKVEPLVLDLMKDDQVALKSGKKTRVEVAEAAMALADKADSEAAKMLLMKGAFNLYVRAGEFDKAIETLQALQAAIPDIPPANMANIIEASLRVVSRKNGGQLYRLLDETKTRMRYTSAAKKMEKALKENPNDRQLRTKLAEHYAYLGKWDKALENFIAADGKAGAIAKAEQGGEAGEKAADFWWSYPTGKADELVKSFRTHAAKLYEDAIADGKITGLNKVQAERRIAETKEYGELTGFMVCIDGDQFKLNVKAGSVSVLQLDKDCRMEFAYCPAGSMNMLFTKPSERVPYKKQTITHGYWLGCIPVSPKQWTALMGDKTGMRPTTKDVALFISYDEMNDYLEMLNRRFSSKIPSGYQFRFPTSAEFTQAQAAMDESKDNPFWPVDTNPEDGRSAKTIPNTVNPWGLKLLGSFAHMLYDTTSVSYTTDGGFEKESSKHYAEGIVKAYGGRPWYGFERRLPTEDPILITPGGRPLTTGWGSQVWRKGCYVRPSGRVALRVCIGPKIKQLQAERSKQKK